VRCGVAAPHTDRRWGGRRCRRPPLSHQGKRHGKGRVHRRRWWSRRPVGRVRTRRRRRRGHGARARRLLRRQERHRRPSVRESDPRLLPRALGGGALRASRRPRAHHHDGRRRPHDVRACLGPPGRRPASVVHGRARPARPVARREGRREGRHGRPRHEGGRAAAQGRPHRRYPRRRRRDRRRRGRRRRGRVAAVGGTGRARRPAGRPRPRPRLQGSHRVAGRRDRRPLEPQSRRGRRPVVPWVRDPRHAGRRLPLHEQGEHLARRRRRHAGDEGRRP